MTHGLSIAIYRPSLAWTGHPPRLRPGAQEREDVPAFVARALQRGTFKRMMTLVGETGFLPNHMLRFHEPLVAIETSTGLAWLTGHPETVAIGSIFSLLGYAELEAAFFDPSREIGLRMGLTPDTSGKRLADAVSALPGVRVEADAIVATVNRTGVVALLLALLDGLPIARPRKPGPLPYHLKTCALAEDDRIR